MPSCASLLSLPSRLSLQGFLVALASTLAFALTSPQSEVQAEAQTQPKAELQNTQNQLCLARCGNRVNRSD